MLCSLVVTRSSLKAIRFNTKNTKWKRGLTILPVSYLGLDTIQQIAIIRRGNSNLADCPITENLKGTCRATNKISSSPSDQCIAKLATKGFSIFIGFNMQPKNGQDIRKIVQVSSTRGAQIECMRILVSLGIQERHADCQLVRLGGFP